MNVAPTAALCNDPFCALIVIAGAALFVKLKCAEADAPEAVADTVKVPAVVLAVNFEEVAKPLEFVVSVSVIVPLAKVPPAPEDGAVKVTATPPVGTPPRVATATKDCANAVDTTALCRDPLLADTTSGPELFEDDEFEVAQPDRNMRADRQVVIQQTARAFR